ncbi:MAG: hypothetical protein AAFV53_14995 [Myxococcota bacterium]
MGRWLFTAMIAAGLTGCYSRDSYTDDVTRAYCTLYEDCEYFEQLDYTDYQECEFFVSEEQDPENFLTGCDYDRAAAIDCVEGINQMECADLEDADFPVDCGRVCTKGQ